MLSSATHPHGKKLHDKALCLVSSIELSWRRPTSTLISLFGVATHFEWPPLWSPRRRELEKSQLTQSHLLWLTVDGSQYRSLEVDGISTSWNDSGGGQRTCHGECSDERPKCGYYKQTWQKYLLMKKRFHPTCGRCYLRGPLKAVWAVCLVSGGRAVCLSSVRVGQRTGRGRERGWGWIEKRVFKNVNQDASGWLGKKKLSP